LLTDPPALADPSVPLRQAPVLYAGVVVEGGLAIASGYFTHLAPTDTGRMAAYCILRAVQGLGGAASYTAISARLADRFPHRLGQVMGLQECFAGAGYTLGPPLGACTAGSSFFPHRLGQVMGLQECFAGAGYTLGPPLGACTAGSSFVYWDIYEL
jgi:MFS family permease